MKKFWGGLFLAFLILGSEVLYHTFNKTDIFLDLTYTFSLRETMASLGESTPTLVSRNLVDLFDNVVIQIQKKYGDRHQINISKEKLATVREIVFSETEVAYLKNIDLVDIPRENTLMWAKMFYTLGLMEYERSNPENAVAFWQMATSLAPEWGEFHIELANLHLTLGNTTGFKKELDYCMTFVSPKLACAEFENRAVSNYGMYPVGLMQSTIESL